MSRRTLLYCWLLLLVAIAAIYRPGLYGALVFDDIPNIAENPKLRINDLSPASLYQAAMSGRASEFRRPLAMLSFGVNYAFTRGDVFYLKLTNLVIHLINVLLAGAFTATLVRSYPCFARVRDQAPAIALTAAAAWGLHPLQVSTTLYVVQRMTLLSATFTLAALMLYTAGRLRQQRGERGSAHLVVAALVFAPLAFLCKETGVLFLAYALVIELFGSMPSQHNARAQPDVRLLLLLVILGAVAAAAYFAVKMPGYAPGYYLKGFSATERLLTEPRVLIWYLKMILLPDTREMGLVHDDWPVSHALFEPPSTALSLAALLIAVAALPWLRKTAPAAALCIGWFLAGHSLEASPIPLDLVYEHRNYLPSLGIFVGLTCAAAYCLGKVGGASRATPLIAAAVLGALALLTELRVDEWESPLKWSIAQTTHHPSSAYSFLDLGATYASAAAHLPDAADRQTFFQRADTAYVEAFRLNPRIVNAPASRIFLRLSSAGEVPQQLFDQVAATLRVGGIPASSQFALVELIACAAKNQCPMSDTHFMAMINAALENPSCPAFLSAQLLALAAQFYGEKEGNVRMAVTLAEAAAEIPNAPMEVRISQIYWLTVAGYRRQALAALDALDQLDTLGDLKEQRREFRRILEAPADEGRKPGEAPSVSPKIK